LIDLNALRQIWRISPMEFIFALIAMFGPIGLGVLYGVVIAIGATLLYVLRQMMFPRDAALGRMPGRDGFYKLHRSPSARPVPGLAITIVQGSLLFFNSDHVESRLRAIAEALPAETEWFVLDASAIAHIDSTGAAMLDAFAADLAKRRMAFGLAELHSDAFKLLERAGVLERVGSAMIFDDLDDALRAFEGRGDRKLATQMPS
jgi:MFS superfamily sulfate permease-like transporter